MAKRKNSQVHSKRRSDQSSSSPAKKSTWIWVAGGGVVLVLLVIGLFYLGEQGPAIANSDIEGLVIFPDPGREHHEGEIDYHDDVPAGGAHSATWLNCGIYDEPVEEEPAVHSLEHGAVWLAYVPDLPTDQVKILRDLVRQEHSRRGEPLVILAPKPDLDAPIVATAWRVQLNLDNASDERLVKFVQRYQRGPFTPEPGASCVDGIGESLS